jgi:hypothetical protein
MTTVTTVLKVRKERAGRRRRRAKAEKRPDKGVPRIARLMALAIKFKGMLEDGTVQDLSELARLARVSQPRMTQIMNLTFLAPEIQESLLFSDTTLPTRRYMRALQVITNLLDWAHQRSREVRN